MADLDAPMPPRQRQALLQSSFPDWMVWYVARAVGGFTWCARRQDEPDLTNTLTTDTAANLADLIEQAQAGDAVHRTHILGPGTPRSKTRGSG